MSSPLDLTLSPSPVINNNHHQLTGHVIFTTHWDREWIQTFEQYRFRLVEMMDQMLAILGDEPSLRFLLDGQAVVLEDYLAIRPEKRAQMEALGQAGRLVVGPWYILADQFLECDEATVRNLLLGFRLSRPFGGPMMHGYVPDSFGSVTALPTILNGFGIRHANLRHGRAHMRDIDAPVVRWQGPDGSEILVLFRGYGEAIDMAYPNQSSDISLVTPTTQSAAEAAGKVIERERAMMPVPQIYLSTGTDHMPMRTDMSSILASLSRNIPNVQWIVSDPHECLLAIEAAVTKYDIELETVEGEMRGERRKPTKLDGAITTNVTVKRLNRECEILIYRLLEPLACILESHTGQSCQHMLDHLWKLVIQSHAHDSICACSRDEVMVEIIARFEKVKQLSAVISERWMRHLFPASPFEIDHPPAVVLLNTVAGRGCDCVSAQATVPHRLTAKRYELVDRDGNVVGSARPLAVRRNDMETFYATASDLVTLRCKAVRDARIDRDCYTVVDLKAEMDFGDASGFHLLQLQPSKRKSKPVVTLCDRGIANERIAVHVMDDGSIELKDLKLGARYPYLFWLHDSADWGDTYRRMPLASDQPILSEQPVQTRYRQNADDSATLEIIHRLNIPRDSNKTSRSQRTIAHRIVIALTIHSRQPMVTIRVKLNNRAVHHCLRLGMRFAGRPSLQSGGHFGVLSRQWADHDDPCADKPMTDFLHLDMADQRGLCVMTKGLYEFKAQRRYDGDSDLYVTLLRPTDMIGEGAGCNYPVEHAREIGQREMELAISLSDSLEQSINRAAAYTTPILATGVIGHDQVMQNVPQKLVELSNSVLYLSCLKPADDGNGMIVRCVNPSKTAQSGKVRLHLPHHHVQQTDLSERAIKTLIIDKQGWVTFHAQACQIITLRFKCT